jgi:hypothetical protein
VIDCRTALPLGRVFATPGLRNTCGLAWLHECLARHARGDWGSVSQEDAEANDRAVMLGGRVFSEYPLGPNGEAASASSLWIITDADRVLTTCLLPTEF